jgi:hypothetical protein
VTRLVVTICVLANMTRVVETPNCRTIEAGVHAPESKAGPTSWVSPSCP